jgi:hypothetical protein
MRGAFSAGGRTAHHATSNLIPVFSLHARGALLNKVGSLFALHASLTTSGRVRSVGRAQLQTRLTVGSAGLVKRNGRVAFTSSATLHGSALVRRVGSFSMNATATFNARPRVLFVGATSITGVLNTSSTGAVRGSKAGINLVVTLVDDTHFILTLTE